MTVAAQVAKWPIVIVTPGRASVLINEWVSLVAQLVKNLPAVQETQVRFLGWEDPLEKEMATHSSILAWKISWTEGCSPWGCKESTTTEQLTHPQRGSQK